nr:hypothetical protein KPH11_71 [Klebsiella pneumoniae subsp. pneumoniae]APA22955.1 hypothetical protein [Salmonella enterica subsp. enterica serovar Typhimurium]
MRQLIQINVSLPMPVCRHRCMAFSDIRKHRCLIFSGCNIPEQHLKALSVAVRFNTLNRQSGIL